LDPGGKSVEPDANLTVLTIAPAPAAEAIWTGAGEAAGVDWVLAGAGADGGAGAGAGVGEGAAAAFNDTGASLAR